MDKGQETIAILLLAAGSSSRMGRPKQLLPWKGTTLLGNAIKNAIASQAGEIVVVLGANAGTIRDSIQENQVKIIENPFRESGLGSSIACGMEYLNDRKAPFTGLLIMLADQPLIDSNYLNLMIDSFSNEEKGIIATAYKKRAGVPALFGKTYFDALSKLADDFGAKEILAENMKYVQVLDPKNKTIDIDTKKEYQKLINTTNNTDK